MLRVTLPVFVVVAALAGSAAAQISAEPQDWPQWRGPNRDGVSLATGLLKSWPADGPKVAWSVESAGVGYSSLAAKGNFVVTQGDIEGVEHIICLSLNTGETVWVVQPAPVAAFLANRLDKELAQMDANKDGVVQEAEAQRRLGWRFNNYNKAVKVDGVTPLQVAERRVAGLLTAFDADKDGAFSFGEASFKDQFAQIDRADRDADAAALAAKRTSRILEAYDKDDDGKLDQRESNSSPLRRSFRRADIKDPDTGKADDVLTKAEIRDYFEQSEAGKDGLIEPAELAKFLSENYPYADDVLTRAEYSAAIGGYRNGAGDGPRGTPTIDGDRVYVVGGNGDVTCLKLANGETIWHKNLSRDFGGGRPGWGYSESPLIDGDAVIVTPGGNKGTLLALDKSTGEELWRSGALTEGAHYASSVLARIGGERQVVQFARGSVFGVSAKDGSLRWRYSGANNGTANCATPIVFEDHVFASSAYGTGGGLAKIDVKDGAFSASEVYFEKKMANHHGGIVRFGKHLYGFGSGGLICMDMMTGKIAWQNRSVGKGSLLVADGKLFLLSEGHQVGLAEATPEEYRELGRFRIERHGRPSWAHPALAGGKLLIRDQHSVTAYHVSGE
ncbi:MAG: PQQ-binding-like beta-propeller repeat protein [Pirellulaceae bacterium]|jgi:hypothetical protein|nr:PQQ-binding-like beta-propeller repeat protein [Pirellulaceae bacterium]